MTILERAQQVLSDEALAIEGLKSTLDHQFETAVHMILESRGRVVCTGMGKSGHIGRKIAATLASTGTPSFFLHPGEGVHGDLGMVTSDDIVLAFSNSGETNEVISLLPSLRRIGAKLIAVVGNKESTLGRNGDITLLVSVEREACPLGLAPTTSTTAALALGDALALCLLDKREFTPENFALFHPGGSLGRRLLLTVRDVMHTGEDNPIVSPQATVKEALFVMTNKGLGAASVIDEKGLLLGLVTDGDIRRGLEQGESFLTREVRDMMTINPKRIIEEKLAAEALHMMEKNKPRPITVLPVVNYNDVVVGMVHVTDLLRRGIV